MKGARTFHAELGFPDFPTCKFHHFSPDRKKVARTTRRRMEKLNSSVKDSVYNIVIIIHTETPPLVSFIASENVFVGSLCMSLRTFSAA